MFSDTARRADPKEPQREPAPKHDRTVFACQCRITAACKLAKTAQLGQWILHWHPNLPVREIRSPAGTQVGWILGLAVDTEGRTLPPVWHLPFDCDDVAAADRFESELDCLGGRSAAVFLTSRSKRFYLDASGSLAAVYCQDRQAIASSCNLIPEIAEMQQDLALIRAFELSQRYGYFPFGLTPWFHITRLLPNH